MIHDIPAGLFIRSGLSETELKEKRRARLGVELSRQRGLAGVKDYVIVQPSSAGRIWSAP